MTVASAFLDAPPLPPAAARVVLALQVFVGGAVVMSMELLGSRLLAPHFGSTLYVWGSLIGVVLTALAVGAHVGGRHADRVPELDRLSWILLVAGGAAVALPLLAPWLLTAAGGLGLVWGPLVSAAVLLGPPAALLGAATPFAVRLSSKELVTLGRTSGGVYALSTAGSIVGTFATAFVLVPNFRVATLFVALGVSLVAVALLGTRRRATAMAVAAGFLLLSPASVGFVERGLFTATTALTHEELYETESAYHHIQVLQGRLPVGDGHVRTLVMDGLVHASMYTHQPNESAAEYVYQFHVGPLFTDNLTNILFIGAGGFSAPKKFLEAYPNVSVDVVEVDPEVVRVAEEWFHAPTDDPRVRVFVQDGRQYLRDADRKYDLVVLDAYSRTYIPFHLMTAEFFFELRDVLAPGGAVVSNVIAALDGPASDILRAEVKTMDQAFAETYVFPVRGARYPFAQNVVVVATEERTRSTAEDLVARAEARPAVPDLPEYAAGLHEGLDLFGAPVLRDDLSAVELLLNPVTGQPYDGG